MPKGLQGFQKGHESFNIAKPRWKCVVCGEQKVRPGRKYCSQKCYGYRLREEMKGQRSPGWRGGTGKPNELVRKTAEYKLWRTSVFLRDNFTCVFCGVRGVVLNADHIKPFSLYPELRFAIDNGRTLCEPCHRKTPTYAGRIKNL